MLAHIGTSAFYVGFQAFLDLRFRRGVNSSEITQALRDYLDQKDPLPLDADYVTRMTGKVEPI